MYSTRVYCRLQVRAAHGERRQNASLSFRFRCVFPAVLSHIYPRYIAPPAHLIKTQQHKKDLLYCFYNRHGESCSSCIINIKTSEIYVLRLLEDDYWTFLFARNLAGRPGFIKRQFCQFCLAEGTGFTILKLENNYFDLIKSNFLSIVNIINIIISYLKVFKCEFFLRK